MERQGKVAEHVHRFEGKISDTALGEESGRIKKDRSLNLLKFRYERKCDLATCDKVGEMCGYVHTHGISRKSV